MTDTTPEPDEDQFNEDDDISGMPEPTGELQDSALDREAFEAPLEEEDVD